MDWVGPLPGRGMEGYASPFACWWSTGNVRGIGFDLHPGSVFLSQTGLSLAYNKTTEKPSSKPHTLTYPAVCYFAFPMSLGALRLGRWVGGSRRKVD